MTVQGTICHTEEVADIELGEDCGATKEEGQIDAVRLTGQVDPFEVLVLLG